MVFYRYVGQPIKSWTFLITLQQCVVISRKLQTLKIAYLIDILQQKLFELLIGGKTYEHLLDGESASTDHVKNSLLYFRTRVVKHFACTCFISSPEPKAHR